MSTQVRRMSRAVRRRLRKASQGGTFVARNTDLETDSEIGSTKLTGSHTHKAELVDTHRAKLGEIKDIQTCLEKCQRILDKLADDYITTRSDCFCFRTRSLQNSIEEAVESYKVRVLGLAPRDGGKFLLEDEDDEEQLQKEEADRKMSLIQRIREGTRRLSMAQAKVKEQAKQYSEMDSEDLHRVIRRADRELASLSRQLESEERKLKRLMQRFELVRSFVFWRRYSIMAEIVQEATVDCGVSYQNYLQ